MHQLQIMVDVVVVDVLDTTKKYFDKLNKLNPSSLWQSAKINPVLTSTVSINNI